MPAVVVKTGPEAGRRIELGHVVAIGRQDGDLVLEDPEVSRRHAVLRPSGGSVVVEDLGSTNGTFVNGERIRNPVTVGPGDHVRVGRTTLEVELDPRAEDTIVSQPADRLDETMVSLPLPPDQIPSVEPSDGRVAEDEDATQPLPSRTLERGSRPARSKTRWLGVGVAALILLTGGLIAYTALVDRSAENDFADLANDACAALARPDRDVNLSSTPTRSELQRARNTRLKAFGALRALDRPEDAAEVEGFLSAFGDTNASITRLEEAIGEANRAVARALGSLRADLRDERELAAKAGIAECGGLSIR